MPNQCKHPILRTLITVITLSCGLLNIFSVIGPIPAEQLVLLQKIFSIQFLAISKFLTLVLGFALVISSINIYRQKERAYYFVFAFAGLSVIFHLTKNLDFESAVLPFLLMVILFYSRKTFNVRSHNPNFRLATARLGLTIASALAYSVAGFWFLEKSDLGFNFDLRDSLYYSMRALCFSLPAGLIPTNDYAIWFLHSLRLVSFGIISMSLFTFFKPAEHKNKSVKTEKSVVQEILEKHGTSSLDFFKLWNDKSYYFSNTTKSFLAYRIEDDSIVVLGDPIGPKEELEELIKNFAEFCSQHDWQLSFFQTTEYNLEIYQRLGFRKLKIGDDAIVNLESFDLVGPKKKDFRNRIRKLEKLGYSINYYDAPLPDRVLVRLKQISHDWLMEPGHRERGFSLGYYQDDYIQSHPVMTVENEEGLIVAFLNIIPSYKGGEMGLDLMRKSKEAPSGVMDYLFVQYILKMQELGYKSVNIGMAPMSGFHEHERASFEEKAIHNLFQRLNFLFNYIGLKVFKSKFADSWEPRYLIYKDAPSLPKLAMTINTVLNKV